jgi:transketolase
MSTTVSIDDPDQLAIATIRTLCIDAVQQANSGHPGTPMAMAPVAYGASAPLKELQTKFGFTPEAAVGIARERVAAAGPA